MKRNIRIDFSGLLVGDFLDLVYNLEDPNVIYEFADKVVVGGIRKRPFSELPAIIKEITKELEKKADGFAIVLSIAKQAKHTEGDNDTL